jgi:RES domain-containing protein
VKIGGDCLRSLRSAILLLPSVIVPEEWVALINPAHKDADRIVGEVARSFDYSRLFRPA